MRSRLYTTTTPVFLLIISAAASTFINHLPSCWQTCIEKRGPQCDSTDLNCLCHFAATTTLLPTLLTCVRKTCDSKYYPEFLTAPLQSMQSACEGTLYELSTAAVRKADEAAESAYSAAAEIDRGRVTRTGSGDVETMGNVLVEVGKSTTTGRGTSMSVMSHGLVASSEKSVGSTTTRGLIVSGFVATSSSASSTSSMSTGTSARTSRSTSVSVAHAPSDNGGGTPLDVGEQGRGVKRRAGSLLGLAIGFGVGVWW